MRQLDRLTWYLGQLACDVLVVCEHHFQAVLQLPNQVPSFLCVVAGYFQSAHNLILAGNPRTTLYNVAIGLRQILL